MPRKVPKTPKVIRQEVLWVPESRRVPVTEFPYRIWTLYGHTDPEVRPALPMTPVHRNGAFMEDYVHDWNVRSVGTPEMVLTYYSRAMDSRVWILVEYANINPFARK
jgi:hypothetical protein